MTVYSYLFGLIIAITAYVVYLKYVNFNISLVKKADKRYDYIIVGAGTSGCVLAARLSENPRTKVLLVEAGDHMGYFTKIPLTATAAQLGPNDWSVRTVSQKYSSFGMWDQTSVIPRGKGLGGSGQINFLMHGFGLPEDFDKWNELGFKDWNYTTLKPYFLKAFGTTSSEYDSYYCSSNEDCLKSKAPMKLQQLARENELYNIFKRASKRLKNRHTIFKTPTATVKNAVRHSAFDAYLKPVLNRKNLHVLLKTQAITIRFENKRASSVFILQNHKHLDNIFARKEIIIAAGVIKTPQLLIMSGVGPMDQIKKLNVNLISHNEHVGKNYHDHMNMPIYVSINKAISVTLSKVFTFNTVWDYYWKNTGLLSFPPVAGLEYQNSSVLLLFSMGTASEKLLRELSNYKQKVFKDTFAFHDQSSKEGCMFLATCAQPKSRGEVRVTAASSIIPPQVNPNYLSNHWDVGCMIQALRRAESLVMSKPFQDMEARIHWPRPERCMSLWRYSKQDQMGTRKKKTKTNSDIHSPPDQYLECIIREVAVTGHHAAGTCAGGHVVDDQMRVKSVRGLRIMDASVLPSPVSLFPNSILIAMAERTADIIKKNQFNIK